jgi:hypothetical protein
MTDASPGRVAAFCTMALMSPKPASYAPDMMRVTVAAEPSPWSMVKSSFSAAK